jgi:hypothetical protein
MIKLSLYLEFLVKFKYCTDENFILKNGTKSLNIIVMLNNIIKTHKKLFKKTKNQKPKTK